MLNVVQHSLFNVRWQRPWGGGPWNKFRVTERGRRSARAISKSLPGGDRLVRHRGRLA